MDKKSPDRNTEKRREICLKLTIETPERLMTTNAKCSNKCKTSIFIINFEHSQENFPSRL